jgi:hypothetical protein
MRSGADQGSCHLEEAGDMTPASDNTAPQPSSPRRAAASPCDRLASRTSEDLDRRVLQGSPKVGSCLQNVASDGDPSGGVAGLRTTRDAGRLIRFGPTLEIPLCNSAVEQAASAARPWQKAQTEQPSWGGPRPGPRSPQLTAGVTKATRVLSWRAGFRNVPARCADVQTAALAAPKERAT